MPLNAFRVRTNLAGLIPINCRNALRQTGWPVKSLTGTGREWCGRETKMKLALERPKESRPSIDHEILCCAELVEDDPESESSSHWSPRPLFCCMDHKMQSWQAFDKDQKTVTMCIINLKGSFLLQRALQQPCWNADLTLFGFFPCFAKVDSDWDPPCLSSSM